MHFKNNNLTTEACKVASISQQFFIKKSLCSFEKTLSFVKDPCITHKKNPTVTRHVSPICALCAAQL